MRKYKLIFLIGIIVFVVISVIGSIQSMYPTSDTENRFDDEVENAIDKKISKEWYSGGLERISIFNNFDHLVKFNIDFVENTRFYNSLEDSLKSSELYNSKQLKRINKILFTDTLNNSYTYSVVHTTDIKSKDSISLIVYYHDENSNKISDIIMVSEPEYVEDNKTWLFSTQFLINRPPLINTKKKKNDFSRVIVVTNDKKVLSNNEILGTRPKVMKEHFNRMELSVLIYEFSEKIGSSK